MLKLIGLITTVVASLAGSFLLTGRLVMYMCDNQHLPWSVCGEMTGIMTATCLATIALSLTFLGWLIWFFKKYRITRK